MRRALLAGLVLAAGAGSTVAFAASLGTVTASSLTSYAAASKVTPSSCTLTAWQDASIERDKQNGNYGSESTLLVTAGTQQKDRKRALVQFDLSPSSSCLSAGAKLVSASLQLYLAAAPSSGRTYDLDPIADGWDEGSVTWRNAPSASGTSATASTGSSGDWTDWDVTSDVAGFLGGGANYGWMIADASESSDDATGTFDSSEGGDAPRLVIEYWP